MKGKAAAAGEYCGWTDGQDVPSLDTRRYSAESRHLANDEHWKLRKQVLNTVTDKSGLRWAHEILALYDAGVYPHEHGYKMACEALNVDPKQVETSW